jgi:CheY-like chemotaxis protein
MRTRPDQGDPGPMEMRCLMVDDNACFLHAMRSMLERDGVTIVGAASNGDEALERAGTCRPDVVLIDVRLGCENGFEVAHRIEELAAAGGRRPTIIMVSTHVEDELADRIAANPSFGFLNKTLVSRDRIRELLSARGARG